MASNSNIASNSLKKNKINKILITVIIIILLVLLGIGGYFLYKKMQKYKSIRAIPKNLLPYIHNASISRIMGGNILPVSGVGNEYNYNFWIYINDYVYRKDVDKCIIYKGQTPAQPLNNSNPLASSNGITTNGVPNAVVENGNPAVWLLANVNTLRVTVGMATFYDVEQRCLQQSRENFATTGLQQLQYNTGTSQNIINTNTDLKAMYCDVENIPLQTWVNVNVSQHTNIIDICLNGKLVKSCILPGSPIETRSEKLYICPDGGFNGYISQFVVVNNAMPVSAVNNIYKQGPSNSKLDTILSKFSL
jgi:hypothetical protein